MIDRIGRKPVFILCTFGVLLDFTWTFSVLAFPHIIPLRLILLAPVLTAVGGGQTVAIAVLYSIAADVESDAHR